MFIPINKLTPADHDDRKENRSRVVEEVGSQTKMAKVMQIPVFTPLILLAKRAHTNGVCCIADFLP